MSITGTVINDTIKLPEGTHMEDGTEVLIMAKTPRRETFLERNRHWIGAGGSGIGDLADNHDHYLYGAPKKTDP